MVCPFRRLSLMPPQQRKSPAGIDGFRKFEPTTRRPRYSHVRFPNHAKRPAAQSACISSRRRISAGAGSGTCCCGYHQGRGRVLECFPERTFQRQLSPGNGTSVEVKRKIQLVSHHAGRGDKGNTPATAPTFANTILLLSGTGTFPLTAYLIAALIACQRGHHTNGLHGDTAECDKWVELFRNGFTTQNGSLFLRKQS